MKVEEELQTIEIPGEGTYSEKSSRFLATAMHCTSDKEAREKRNELKKTHHKAVHVVWAYRTGLYNVEEYCSDDGEPSGSSGMPVLNEIRKRNLSDTAVFVVRYYGGKKLGVPGLINAYMTAASEALGHAVCKTLLLEKTCEVICHAQHQHLVQELISRFGGRVEDVNYGEKCTFSISYTHNNESLINALESENALDVVYPE